MEYTRTDFREHFWGPKHNGFNVLYQNMKAQTLTGKDLVEFVKERTVAEEQYAKHLSKLTKQISVTPSLATHGSFTPYWNLLKESTEKLSNIHMQVVGKLHDLNRDVLRYNEDLAKRQKLRKDQESETVDVVQSMQTTETNLQKAKEVYLLRYTELEKLRKDDASPKDIEKSENKLRKVAEEYQTLVERYGKTRQEFHDKMTKSCENFQELEEQHLSQLRNIFNNYTVSLEFGYALIGELYGDMRRESNSLTTEKLLMSFVDEKGTGCDRPAEIKFDAIQTDVSSIANTNPNPTGANGVIVTKANTGGSMLSTAVMNPTLTGSGLYITDHNSVPIDRRNHSPNSNRDSSRPNADFSILPGNNNPASVTAAQNGSINNRPLSPPSLIHLGESPVMDTRKFFPTVTSSSYSISTISTAPNPASAAVSDLQQKNSSMTITQQHDPFTPPPNVVNISMQMTRSNTGGRSANNNSYADLIDSSRPLGGAAADVGTISPTNSSNLNDNTNNSNNFLIEQQQTGNKVAVAAAAAVAADKAGGGSGGRGSKWPGFLKFGNRDKKQQQYAAAAAPSGGRPVVNNSHTIHVSAGGVKKLHTSSSTTTMPANQNNFDGVFEVSPNWFNPSSTATTPTNSAPPLTVGDSNLLSKVSSNSSLGGTKQNLAPLNALQKGGTLNSVGIDSVGNYSPTMSDDFHLDEEGYRVRKQTAGLESDSMRNKLDNSASDDDDSNSDDDDDDDDDAADKTKKIHIRIKDKAEVMNNGGAEPQNKQVLEQAARILIAPQLTGGRGGTLFTASRTGGSMASNWSSKLNGDSSSTMLTMTPSKTGGATASGLGGNSWMTGGAAAGPSIPNRRLPPTQGRQQSIIENSGTAAAAAQVPPRMLRPAFTGGPMQTSSNGNSKNSHANSYATYMSVLEPSTAVDAGGRNARSRPRPSSIVTNFGVSHSPPISSNATAAAAAEQPFRRPSTVPVPERHSKPSSASSSAAVSLPNSAERSGIQMPTIGASGVEPFPISVNLQEKCSVQLDYSASSSSSESTAQISGSLVGEVYLAFPYKSIETLDANSPQILFSLTPPADAVAPVGSYQPFEKLLKNVNDGNSHPSAQQQFSFNMNALCDYLRNEYKKSSKPYILVPAVRYNIKVRNVEQLPFQLLAQCRYSANRARLEIELDRLSLAESTGRSVPRLVLKARLSLSSKSESTASNNNNPVTMQSIECNTNSYDAAVTKDLSDNSVQVSIADISSGDKKFPSRRSLLAVIEFNYDADETTDRAVVVPHVQIEAHFQPPPISQQQQNASCLLSGMKFALEQNTTHRAYRIAFLKQQIMSVDENIVPAMNFVPFLPAFTIASRTTSSPTARPMSPLEAKRSLDSVNSPQRQFVSRTSVGGNSDAVSTSSLENSPTKLVRSLNDMMNKPINSPQSVPPTGVALRRRISNGPVTVDAAQVDADHDDADEASHRQHSGDVTPTAKTASRSFASSVSGSSSTGAGAANISAFDDWLGGGPLTPNASSKFMYSQTVVTTTTTTANSPLPPPPPSSAATTYDFDSNWILGTKRRPSLTTTTSTTPSILPNVAGLPVIGASFGSFDQQQA